MAATNWDDIAARAGVSPATVYRHFPSLAELVPACARSVFDTIQPLTVEQASATFGMLDRAGDRFDQLVRYTCHCSAAGAGWLRAAYRERDFYIELDAALWVIEDSLRALVAAAAGRRLAKTDHVPRLTRKKAPRRGTWALRAFRDASRSASPVSRRRSGRF